MILNPLHLYSWLHEYWRTSQPAKETAGNPTLTMLLVKCHKTFKHEKHMLIKRKINVN